MGEKHTRGRTIPSRSTESRSPFVTTLHFHFLLYLLPLAILCDSIHVHLLSKRQIELLFPNSMTRMRLRIISTSRTHSDIHGLQIHNVAIVFLSYGRIIGKNELVLSGNRTPYCFVHILLHRRRLFSQQSFLEDEIVDSNENE